MMKSYVLVRICNKNSFKFIYTEVTEFYYFIMKMKMKLKKRKWILQEYNHYAKIQLILVYYFKTNRLEHKV